MPGTLLGLPEGAVCHPDEHHAFSAFKLPSLVCVVFCQPWVCLGKDSFPA